MFEAVGEAFWPTFFGQMRDRLRAGGRAAFQVITIRFTSPASATRRRAKSYCSCEMVRPVTRQPISQEQYDFARRRVAEAGLANRM